MLVLAGAAAALLAGCAQRDIGWFGIANGGQKAPTKIASTSHVEPMPSALTTTQPVAERARDVADLDAAVEMITAGRYQAAERLLQPLPPKFEAVGDADHASASLFWLGYSTEKQSRLAEARGYYTDLLGRYPQTPSGQQARRRLTDLPNP